MNNIYDFSAFKTYLIDSLKLSEQEQQSISKLSYKDIQKIQSVCNLTPTQLAHLIASFLNLPYAPTIESEQVAHSILSTSFCKLNYVVPIQKEKNKISYILCNPFDLELIDMLKKNQTQPLDIIITSPDVMEFFFTLDPNYADAESATEIQFSKDKDKLATIQKTAEPTPQLIFEEDIDYPIISIANNMLQSAVRERASDIHIEPKKDSILVRFRIDGDMRPMFTLQKKTGTMLINRFKVIGEMDFAEKQKPQDGTVEAVIDNRTFKLRLATTTTPDGESMIIRLLEPHAKPKQLSELGMTEQQTNTLIQLSKRTHGLILIVGPTGSGKTTTIYSLLSQIDCKTRSLVTIEDPVEYRIPFANHQQVNEKAGVTFEALLKSVVRQDPDVIFLGEIRDQYSARMAVDFASTGHLTISTLHTTNATTALFRLERLGVNRSIMAEALLCIVAQRLVKKLCNHCRSIVPTPEKEKQILQAFMPEPPETVAQPKGCPYCKNTGYHGREGVYEVMTISPDLAELIRSGTDINHIRIYYKQHGGYLMADHALSKILNYTFSVNDAYEKVLVEELSLSETPKITPTEKQPFASTQTPSAPQQPTILLVDDDPEIIQLLTTILSNRNYQISSAKDGIDALMLLSNKKFDLIISDVNMPNLDGFKLIEIMNQKNIKCPLLFLTSRTSPEDELKGLELGAIDYIKKPIQKDVFLARLSKLLKK